MTASKGGAGRRGCRRRTKRLQVSWGSRWRRWGCCRWWWGTLGEGGGEPRGRCSEGRGPGPSLVGMSSRGPTRMWNEALVGGRPDLPGRRHESILHHGHGPTGDLGVTVASCQLATEAGCPAEGTGGSIGRGVRDTPSTAPSLTRAVLVSRSACETTRYRRRWPREPSDLHPRTDHSGGGDGLPDRAIGRASGDLASAVVRPRLVPDCSTPSPGGRITCVRSQGPDGGPEDRDLQSDGRTRSVRHDDFLTQEAR